MRRREPLRTGVLKIDATREAHGRLKRTTKFGRRERRSIAARGATAHYVGGAVFEVAFLKGSFLRTLSPPRPTLWGVFLGFGRTYG